MPANSVQKDLDTYSDTSSAVTASTIKLAEGRLNVNDLVVVRGFAAGHDYAGCNNMVSEILNIKPATDVEGIHRAMLKISQGRKEGVHMWFNMKYLKKLPRPSSNEVMKSSAMTSILEE